MQLVSPLVSPFVPPRCPNRDCPRHLDPTPIFFSRQGSYRPTCRSDAVPRFRCKTCRKGFSLQTFRADYRDRRPDLNAKVVALLTSGVGLRQAARLTCLSVHAVQRKFRKIGRLVAALNHNLLRQLPPGRTYLLDELETFEDLSILPVTVPVLIEKESKLVVATDAAPIRRVRKRGSKKQRWQQKYELEHGKREDRSRASVLGVMRHFRHLLAGGRAVLLTDEKTLYAKACRDLLPDQVVHLQYSSKLPRNTFNPLFAINHTDAMLRDNCGRLRRRTWLVSKKAEYLRLQLELFAAYRNWVRTRNNTDEAGRTPGVVLGIVPRRLAWGEILAWRQDWQLLSIHPASVSGQETVLDAVA